MYFQLLILGTMLSAVTRGDRPQASEKHLVCYFADRVTYPEQLDMDETDSKLCTHMVYFHGEVHQQDIVAKMPQNIAQGDVLINRTSSIKGKNPKLKELSHITCQHRYTYENQRGLTEDEINSKFAKNAVNYLKNYGFDGLVLERGSNELKGLLAALKLEFNSHGFILATLILPKQRTGNAQMNSEIAQYYDFMMVASYFIISANMTGAFSPLSGLVSDEFEATLVAYQSQKAFNSADVLDSIKLYHALRSFDFNFELMIRRQDVSEYLEMGIPAQKLIVGIPAASVTYTLCYRERTGMSAEICYPFLEDYSSGPSVPVLYTQFKHAHRNASENWVDARDNSTEMMYTYNKDFLWASYEDPVSVRAKVDYIIENDLGGAAVLSLELDDYIGFNGTKFPLTREIHDALRRDVDIVE